MSEPPIFGVCDACEARGRVFPMQGGSWLCAFCASQFEDDAYEKHLEDIRECLRNEWGS